MNAVVTALRAVHPPIVRSADGNFVLADGRRLLDLSSQTLNLALGHTHPAVTAAVTEQANTVAFASSRFGTLPFERLSQELARRAPEGLGAVVLKLCNGSDAVETALKIAMTHTGRRRVACLPGAWHGESFLTLGLASTHHGRLIADADRAVFADTPDIAALTRLVADRRDLAAVILDPAMVSNGLVEGGITALTDALAALRAVCTSTGTMLVFDEIQTFGWLGTGLFVTQLTGVHPDLICLGKAMSAGYPLAAVLCRSDLAAVLGYNDAEFTYGGHPVSCAAALAGLQALDDLGQDLADRTEMFTESLARLLPPEVFEVRRLGLIATITLADDGHRELWTTRTIATCLDAGIHVRAGDHGRRLLIKAPLVVPSDQLHDALDVVATAGRATRTELPTPAVPGGLVDRLTITTSTADPGRRALGALLASATADLTPRTRAPAEHRDLARDLTLIGVAVTPHDIVSGRPDTVDVAHVSGRTLHDVLGDPTTDPALVNGLVLRHQDAVVRAHQHGVVIGNRHPGTALVVGHGHLLLTAFTLCYDGASFTQILFEDVLCVVSTIAAVHPAHACRADLVKRLLVALVERHGARAASDALTAITDFYTTLGHRACPPGVRVADPAAAILALRPGLPDAYHQPVPTGSRTET